MSVHNMGFQYYWTAVNLWARGEILFTSLVFILRERPLAVAGQSGTYALTEVEGGKDDE